MRDEGTYVCVCEWREERMRGGGGRCNYVQCMCECMGHQCRVEMVHTEK